MQASYSPARLFMCVPLLLLSISAAGQAQTSISINNVGGHSDEQKIELALTQRGSIDFAETRLQDVVDALSRQFHVPIIVATRKLEEASVSLDAPISKKLNDLPLESILRLILADVELRFTVRDNVILISSPEDIESRLDTCVYPVLDLVRQRTSTSQEAPSRIADYDSLIEVITSTIDPNSWDDVGGPGAIDALDSAGALVISQTRDVHRQIENLLVSLRRVKAVQGLASLPMPTIAVRSTASRPITSTTGPFPTAPAHAWQLPHVHPAAR